MSKNINSQKGSALIEAAIAIPVVCLFLFLTCSISFVALERNHIQEEMQRTVRLVAISGSGSCSELAEDILKTRLRNLSSSEPGVYVRTNNLYDGRIELKIQVALNISQNSATNSSELIERSFRVRIENPDGCSVA